MGFRNKNDPLHFVLEGGAETSGFRGLPVDFVQNPVWTLAQGLGSH